MELSTLRAGEILMLVKKPLIMLVAMSCFIPCVSHAETKLKIDLSSYVSKISDLTAEVIVEKVQPEILEKIGKDFGTPYLFKKLNLSYLSPDKIRLDGKSSVFGSALLIINGSQRLFSVPRLGQKGKEDLTKFPGKRLTSLEYLGILSKGTLDHLEAKESEPDLIESTKTLKLSLYFKETDHLIYRIWIDPKTNVVLKRVWYDNMGEPKATFLYSEITEVSKDIWLPGRVEILNAKQLANLL